MKKKWANGTISYKVTVIKGVLKVQKTSLKTSSRINQIKGEKERSTIWDIQSGTGTLSFSTFLTYLLRSGLSQSEVYVEPDSFFAKVFFCFKKNSIWSHRYVWPDLLQYSSWDIPPNWELIPNFLVNPIRPRLTFSFLPKIIFPFTMV